MDPDFENNYLPFTKALQTLSDEDLRAIGYAFGILVVPNLGDVKWQWADAIFAKLRQHHVNERRLADLHEAFNVFQRELR